MNGTTIAPPTAAPEPEGDLAEYLRIAEAEEEARRAAETARVRSIADADRIHETAREAETVRYRFD